MTVDFPASVHVPHGAPPRLALLATLAAAFVMPGATGAAATLAELLNGGTLTANNSRFENFQLVSLDATAAAGPDLSLVSVAPLVNDVANPGLQFTANGQLSVSGVNAIDLQLSFDVRAVGTTPSLAGATLSMASVTFGGSGGIAYILHEITSQSGADLGVAMAMADNQSDVFDFTDETDLSPHKTLSVNMNVFLTGIGAADTIDLSNFTTRFWQTGPLTQAGDFNNDNVVDGADLLAWQRGQSPSPLSSQDLATWKANFGSGISLTPSVATVPEPGAAALALLGCAALAARRRRR